MVIIYYAASVRIKLKSCLFVPQKCTVCLCAHLTQVNAQVLASTFTQESYQLIKLGEAVGALLQSFSASKKPFSHVKITTQGKITGVTSLL